MATPYDPRSKYTKLDSANSYDQSVLGSADYKARHALDKGDAPGGAYSPEKIAQDLLYPAISSQKKLTAAQIQAMVKEQAASGPYHSKAQANWEKGIELAMQQAKDQAGNAPDQTKDKKPYKPFGSFEKAPTAQEIAIQDEKRRKAKAAADAYGRSGGTSLLD